MAAWIAMVSGAVLLASTTGSIAASQGGKVENRTPYIPPQCYTKTVGADGGVRNTCYTCHTKGIRPQFTNDQELQLKFAFPLDAQTNPWANFFDDRTAAVAAMGDREILAYIRSANYMDADGGIALARALKNPPPQWDADKDGRWSGYVPDCYFNFDDAGFDKDSAGAFTGWRAMATYPFPSTHWPTNGSFADVSIRLPRSFRTRDQRFDRRTYQLNLAILEALIKKRDVPIAPVDEKIYGVDLDKDGKLAQAGVVAYDWAPNKGRHMSYVGDAGQLQRKGELHLAAGLFPEGTEFLSTLRYLDISDDGRVRPSRRMKEIRYLKKRKWLTYAQLELNAMDEIKEKHDFQDRLKIIFSDLEQGASNGKGWVLQGFIEDENGRLRPQSVEENKSCVGCHGGIGATTDAAFSMARKLDASQYRQGWYHWSQKDMAGLNEPKVAFGNAGVQYEYCFYLIYGQAGDAFRANDEVRRNFFDAKGHLRPEMAAKTHDDLSILLYPSKSRALALDKAYRTIVKTQSFTMGRSAIVAKATQMFDRIQPQDIPTGVKRPVALTRFPYDVAAPHRPDVAPTDSAKLGQAAIDGPGMAGPDGRRYQIDGRGLIDESSYALDQSGYYFPFPSRHTLPTRIIVPNADIPSCYECHRLDAAMPPGITKVKTAVALGRGDAKGSDRQMKRLTNHAGVDTYGVWSPDGKQIAWVSDRSEGYQIWTMRADGSHKKQITRGPAIHGWPAWSPDGKRLVYWGFDSQSGRSTLSVCRVDGMEALELIASQDTLDRPQWRPDGKYVAYARQHEGNWDIWVAAGDGSRFYQMTHDAQMETNPLWSPDGLSIAYKVAPGKTYNLTIENFMSVKDGFDAPQYRMWDGIKSIQMNDWSPKGNKIAYTAEAVTNASGRDRVSYVAVVEDISLTGSKTSGTPVVLAQGATLGDRGPVFSPDGRRIVFWAWDTAYRATLWTADADGSNLTRLTTDGDDMYPRWRPDGKAILFESARGGSMDIWTLSVD